MRLKTHHEMKWKFVTSTYVRCQYDSFKKATKEKWTVSPAHSTKHGLNTRKWQTFMENDGTITWITFGFGFQLVWLFNNDLQTVAVIIYNTKGGTTVHSIVLCFGIFRHSIAIQSPLFGIPSIVRKYDLLPNHFIYLWKCPGTLTSDDNSSNESHLIIMSLK